MPPRTILILEYLLPLGYLVHMTPVFEAIKRARPEVTLVCATRGIGLEVLRESPFVDHLLETPDPLTHLPAAILSLRRQLRTHGLRPDCCLTGTADQRSRIALLAALGSPGWRGGFTVHHALYRCPLTYDPAISRMANNLRIAELAGCPAAPEPEPRIFFSTADAEYAQALMTEPGPTLAILACNSGGHPTAWLDERWAAVVRYAQNTLGYRVVYPGTAADAPAIDRIRTLSGGAGTSLAGLTTVPQLAALLALCDMAVSITTGAMHVCRAVGTPMIVLGLAWEDPMQWLAQGRDHIRILRGPDQPRTSGYRMQEISAEQVIEALEEMTDRYPASADARQARVRIAARAFL